jgi:hypothetical protein
MFLDKYRMAGMLALTLAMLVGALSLYAPSPVFAADRSTQPSSLDASSAVRMRLCNVDGDHDNDDVCRVIGNRFSFGNRFSLQNRFLSPKNIDPDHDATFPLKLGPFPRNFGY